MIKRRVGDYRVSIPKEFFICDFVCTTDRVAKLFFPDVPNEKHLCLIPTYEFDRLIEQVSPKKYLFIGAKSFELGVDAQNRVRFGRSERCLLDYAGIESEVVIVAKDDRIELWNPENYEQPK